MLIKGRVARAPPRANAESEKKTATSQQASPSSPKKARRTSKKSPRKNQNPGTTTGDGRVAIRSRRLRNLLIRQACLSGSFIRAPCNSAAVNGFASTAIP